MDLNLQVTATSAVYVRKMKIAYSDVFEQRKSNHAVAPWCFELQPLERSHQGIEFIMVLQQVFDLPKNIAEDGSIHKIMDGFIHKIIIPSLYVRVRHLFIKIIYFKHNIQYHSSM